MFRRLLLLPLLSPLMATLLVASINPRPQVALQLLTWRSPALPIGAWIAAAALAGAGLSGTATALALRETGRSLQRQVRQSRSRPAFGGQAAGAPGAWEEGEWGEGAWAESRPAGGRRVPRHEGQRARQEAEPEATPWSGGLPARAPGEPAPTVSVPYRVIRRGAAAAEPRPVPVEDDWNAAAGDEW